MKRPLECARTRGQIQVSSRRLIDKIDFDLVRDDARFVAFGQKTFDSFAPAFPIV